MIGIVLISHGAFAEGLLDAANMLYGADQCFTLKLNPADNPDDFEAVLEKTIDEADTGEGVFILADIMGGTPCNRAMALISKGVSAGKKRHLVAGASIPMLISLLDNRHSASSFDELAATIISDAGNFMTDVNDIMKKEGLL